MPLLESFQRGHEDINADELDWKLGVLVHTCSPSTWEAEAEGSWVWDQPGLHSDTLSQKQKCEKVVKEFGKNNMVSQHWWLMSGILGIQEAEIRRIKVQSQPGQTVHETLSLNYPTLKGLGEWLKWECLPSKHEALSSNPSTSKKKKKKERKKEDEKLGVPEGKKGWGVMLSSVFNRWRVMSVTRHWGSTKKGQIKDRVARGNNRDQERTTLRCFWWLHCDYNKELEVIFHLGLQIPDG
jgi:hypothetical protein